MPTAPISAALTATDRNTVMQAIAVLPVLCHPYCAIKTKFVLASAALRLTLQQAFRRFAGFALKQDDV